MKTTQHKTDYFKDPLTIAVALASIKIILYLIAGNAYGYFRDELYFIESTNHIALGYPDHAPLSIWIAKFSILIFGDSLYAIHLLSALSGVLKIILTGLLVREFGGRHYATFLACLCVLVAPVYLAIDSLMAMNTYEPIFWMGCVLSYIWVKNRENPKYWLLFGAFAGLGLMNKHSLVFFGFAFVVGLFLTKDRKFFADKYLWLGGSIALLLFLPNLIWQYQNDWATIELLRNVSESGKNVVVSPLEFLWQQVFIMNPVTAPVWLAGIWFLIFDKIGKRFRPLGLAYVLTLGLMLIFKAKHYYLAPIYPFLFATGGVFWENLLSRFRFGQVIKYSYPLILILVGSMLLPLTMPILPIDKFIAYQDALGIAPPKTEVSHEGVLPQQFGDMFGWENMTAKTAEVYNSLSPEERRKAAIFASNYGEAGAIDLFGRKYGLPKAISPHQSYYLWGPGDYDGSVVIILGEEKKDAENFCKSVEEKTRVEHPLAMKYENFDILICRDLKEPFPELWKKIKNWK